MAQYALIAEFDRQRSELYRDVVAAQRLEAIVVRDGNAASRVLRSQGAPILLITDLSLPYTDGFSLIKDVRQISPPEKTAILACSAFAELRAAAWGLRKGLGISDVTDKTVSAEGLTRLVARALAGVTRPDVSRQTDASEPDAVVRKILFRAAETFRVPIVLLSIEFRDQRRLMAYMSVNELQGSPRQWPVLQQVLNSREPLVVPDVTKHPLFGIAPMAPSLVIRGFAAAPLITSSGHLVGVISLLDFEPLRLAGEQIDLLMKAGQRIGDELERQYQADLAEAELAEHFRSEEHWAALERLALTDSLTGLSNRRAGERALEREVARARRVMSPFSLALLDLDHFKKVNDVHGHAAGDDVLCEVSRILTSTFRASDLAVRWGGDEFLVLLPDVTLDGAVIFAERALRQVEALSFPGVGPLTMSAGIVEVGPNEDPRSALTRADAQLYEAKGAGRNRVKSART
ncbi:MAG TPA: diguanylate cyclase [Vicinamibacterales bacterium]|nr:diguanylate cyclase [Vicinamibacterales bacterium]